MFYPLAGRPAGTVAAPSKGMGMKLGKSTKTNQFLESLKAEGEVIVEDLPLPPTSAAGGAAAQPVFVPTDPITIMVEEKLMVVWKRDGGLENMEVQGTMALTVLKEEDAYIRIHVSQSRGQSESNESKVHCTLDILPRSLQNALQQDSLARINCMIGVRAFIAGYECCRYWTQPPRTARGVKHQNAPYHFDPQAGCIVVL